MRRLLLVPILLTCGHLVAAEAELAAKASGILQESCIKCHGPEKQKGKLRLDTAENLKKGGESGAAIEPGNPEKSLLVKCINWEDEDLRMPPKKKLSDDQIAVLTAWVKAGAPYPAAAKKP